MMRAFCPVSLSVPCFVVGPQESRITGNGEGNQCSSPQQCAFSASLPGDYGLRAAYQFRVVCTMCFPLPDKDQGLLRICLQCFGNLGNDINKNPSVVFYGVGEQCRKRREGQMFGCFSSQAPIHPLGVRANTQVASTAVVDAICSRHLGSTLTALNVVVEVTL